LGPTSDGARKDMDVEAFLAWADGRALAPIHDAQVLTYLKLSGLRIGLLVNFNAVLFKHGLKRLKRLVL